MTPSDVCTMSDSTIAEMLVNLKLSDAAVAWLASLIADPVLVAGVNELSRRYAANGSGRCVLPRARCASTVHMSGAKFKELMWRHRIPLNQIGPMIGKSDGLGSVLAHKGRISYWTADAIATELGMHVDEFIAEVGTDEELARLSA